MRSKREEVLRNPPPDYGKRGGKVSGAEFTEIQKRPFEGIDADVLTCLKFLLLTFFRNFAKKGRGTRPYPRSGS